MRKKNLSDNKNPIDVKFKSHMGVIDEDIDEGI